MAGDNNKTSILIISGAPVDVGSGAISVDYYNTFKRYGYDVDLLTLLPSKEHPEFLWVKKKRGKYERFFFRLWNRIVRPVGGHYFFFTRDTLPPTSVKKVLKNIKKQYDVVFVLFWMDFISFRTIERIYDKIGSRFYFACVDYSPMSGGCGYFRYCNRYKIGCGKCPAIHSSYLNDFTRKNIKYRKRVYDKIRPVVLGNMQMQKYFNESYLLKDVRKGEFTLIIDFNKYKLFNQEVIREKYGIPQNKDKILFFGAHCVDDPRKGFDKLIKALNIYRDSIDVKEQEKILLLIAGYGIDSIKDKLPFDYINLGFLDGEKLPQIYSMATAYLSPSIEDAGPSMVNQSLAAGTPVICFKVGIALELVDNMGTGYCAELANEKDFARGIEKVLNLSNDDYCRMRNRCREVALNANSESAFINEFIRLENEFTV